MHDVTQPQPINHERSLCVDHPAHVPIRLSEYDQGTFVPISVVRRLASALVELTDAAEEGAAVSGGPQEALFIWCAFGDPDTPPGRLRVVSCVDCAALVPAERFDIHGHWHRLIERSVTVEE